MRIKLTTVVHTNVDTFWSMLQNPLSLRFVAAPIIEFEQIEHATFETNWKEGETYALPMRYFGHIPAGVRHVTIATIDAYAHRIVTDESGGVAKLWRHTMELQSLSATCVEYKDTLEISADYKTPFLWVFVHLFYRHRQRRWKKLLSRS